MASLAKRSCASTNPAQPLAATEGAIRLCLVHGPEPRSLYLAGAVAIGALPGSAAFSALSCHFVVSLRDWLTLLSLSCQTAKAPIVRVR